MANAIEIVIGRLRSADGLLIAERRITPVRPATDGSAVTVNRLLEQSDEDFTHAVVAVTCLAQTFEEAESLAAAAIAALQDVEGAKPFNFEDAEDVMFEKVGPDVTGYDERTERYLRQIEFAVHW